MWTRTYLLLLMVRLYFAISPSYIHPDENFQGPEVIAATSSILDRIQNGRAAFLDTQAYFIGHLVGKTLNFPHHLTWEFTADKPVRSVFPLWPTYGLPMLVLQWIWTEVGKDDVPPKVAYYSLRVLMFILSFVLEDWALHELIQSPRHRRLAVTLVASSYVTWTYQTHTFSNSIETLVVLWSMVMIQRLMENKQKRDSLLSPSILGALLVFGTFNRITFPAFVVLPGLFLLPHLWGRPLSVLALLSTGLLTFFIGIVADTNFYNPTATFTTLFTSPVITPLNSLLYNSQTSNLAKHGLHPYYQHLLASLPLLLGPALTLLPTITQTITPPRLPFLSALSGLLLLSLVPHQEARFLLPLVPCLLSSIHLPRSRTPTRYWLASWILFNTALGLLMGVYHQGGVVPVQIWLGQQKDLAASTTEVFWWRTYSPPVWLLDHSPLNTTDLMGMPVGEMQATIMDALDSGGGTCDGERKVGLVAPLSSLAIEEWQYKSRVKLEWREVWRYRRHLNLDDLDFEGPAGVVAEVRRVVGRRGLGVWTVGRRC